MQSSQDNESIVTDSTDVNLNDLWELVKDSEGWHAAVCGVTKIQTQLSNGTTTGQCLLPEDHSL